MKIDKSLVTGSMTLIVLSLLRDGDKYGYEMIAELARRSDNTFALKEGTLYPLLHALENDQCITSYLREAESGRARKYYHITEKGRGLLEHKTEEWRFFTEKVNGVVFSGSFGMA